MVSFDNAQSFAAKGGFIKQKNRTFLHPLKLLFHAKLSDTSTRLCHLGSRRRPQQHPPRLNP